MIKSRQIILYRRLENRLKDLVSTFGKGDFFLRDLHSLSTVDQLRYDFCIERNCFQVDIENPGFKVFPILFRKSKKRYAKPGAKGFGETANMDGLLWQNGEKTLSVARIQKRIDIILDY